MQVGRRRARRGREGREGRGMAVRPGRWAVEMTKSYIAVSAKQIGLFFHTASFRSNLPNRVGHGRDRPAHARAHGDLHNCTGWHGPPSLIKYSSCASEVQVVVYRATEPRCCAPDSSLNFSRSHSER